MLSKFSNSKQRLDKYSGLRLFVIFLIISVILFVTLTTAILFPQVKKITNDLQDDVSQMTADSHGGSLHRYLEDRELALQDISDNPLITNSVMLNDSSRPEVLDYIHYVKLLNEDAEISVLNILGEVVYAEHSRDQDYSWTLPLMDDGQPHILKFVQNSDGDFFEIAIPILYGSSREGVVVARLDVNVANIFGSAAHLDSESGITLEKDGLIFSSELGNIPNKFYESYTLEDYGVTLTHITNLTTLREKQSDFMKRFILTAIFGAFVSFTLLYLIGRKLIVQPYTDLENSQNMISKAVEGIAQLTPDGIYTHANQAFAEMTHYTPDQIVGMKANDIIKSDNTDALKVAYEAMVNTGKSVTEVRGYRKNGEEFYARLLFVKKTTDEQGYEGYYCFMQDVTERIQRDVEREQLMTRLSSSNEELERFAYICSHDLQEPLRMVRSFSDKLQVHLGDSLDNDEKGKKYFHFVTDGAERAQILIQDILTYSSLDREENTTNVCMQTLIGQVVDTMAMNSGDRPVDVTYDPLPEVVGNKTQLYQILQNLIGNGLKYQDESTAPKIHVSATELDDHWQFAVKDNGIGIKEQYMGKIFKVFQRLHRRSEYSGTGIGLAICKKVAENHSGKIWAESEYGVGSTFFFTIKKMHTLEQPHDQEHKAS